MRATLLTLSLILLLIAFPVILFFRFDAENLKPAFESHLSRIMAREVHLESLHFKPGLHPEIKISGFVINQGGASGLSIEAPNIVLRMNLAAFIVKKIKISRLTVLDARIHLLRKIEIRNPKDPVSLAEPPIKRAKKADGGMAAPHFFWQKGPWDISIKTIEFRDATASFQDESLSPPFSMALQSMDALVQEAETENVYHFQLQAETFGLPVSMKGVLDAGRRSVLVTGSTVEQEWMFDGAIDLSGTHPQMRGELDSYNFALLHDFIEGRLTIETQGILEGSNPREWFSSITSKGALDIRNGIFKPINVIKEALETSLKALEPALANTTKNTVFPGEISNGDTTVFDLLQANVEIFHEKMFIREGLIKHRHYLLELDGNYDMSRREIDMRAKLVFLESFSEELIQEHPSLEALLNPHGRIVIPFHYNGLLPQAVLKPDEDYLRMRARSLEANQPRTAETGSVPETAVSDHHSNPEV